MKIIRAREFQADRAWGAMDIARMDGITTRLHWTDQPYRWHVNDGQEVFAVLDGVVEMRYRAEGVEKSPFCNLATSSSPMRGVSTWRTLAGPRGCW